MVRTLCNTAYGHAFLNWNEYNLTVQDPGPIPKLSRGGLLIMSLKLPGLSCLQCWCPACPKLGRCLEFQRGAEAEGKKNA